MASQHDDVALTAQPLGDPGREEAAHQRVGRGDEGDELVALDPPIDHHHRDSAAHHAADGRVERLLGVGRDDQEIDVLGHQILDVGHLLGVVVAGISDDQPVDDVGVLGRRPLDRMLHDHAPAVSEPGIGEADDVGGLLGVLAGVLEADLDIGVEEVGAGHALIAVLRNRAGSQEDCGRCRDPTQKRSVRHGRRPPHQPCMVRPLVRGSRSSPCREFPGDRGLNEY